MSATSSENPNKPALEDLIRPERSVFRYSRGWELAQTIHNLAEGDRHPHCDWICKGFDLNSFEWHYWKQIANSMH